MIDPAVLSQQARDARRYVIHVELTGEPPTVKNAEDCDDKCLCGEPLSANSRSGLCTKCRNREWMRAKRAGLPPPVAVPCEVCGKESAAPKRKRTRGGNWDRADLCSECRTRGFRSRRCECGRPLHTRDYASNSKHGKREGNCCGKCRAERNQVAA